MPEDTQEVVSTGTEVGNAAASAEPSTITKESAQSASDRVNGTPTKEVTSPTSEVEAPQYVPNYKYRVSKEEKEFDEFIRSSIKDKDTEEKARKLYTDAYGMEAVKPELDDLRKKYPEIETNYNQLNAAVTEVLDLGAKDLGLFFERLKIPEERVAQYVLDLINKRALPPEQKAVYDQYEQTRRENLALQKQFQELNGQSQQHAVQARTMELESTLQKPEVSSFANTFDAACKKPGAFKDEIRKCGLYEWKVNNRDISAAEATQMVMSRYQGMITPTAIGANPSEPVVEKALPVIPRVQGKSVSPVGKQVRSIADLKKKAAEMAG